MTAVYASKFTLQLSDMARIVFVDERSPLAEGLPMGSGTAAEVVITLANLEALNETIAKTLAQHGRG